MSEFPWTHPDMDPDPSFNAERLRQFIARQQELPQPTPDDRRFSRARVVELERLLRAYVTGTATDETWRQASELLSGGR